MRVGWPLPVPRLVTETGRRLANPEPPIDPLTRRRSASRISAPAFRENSVSAFRIRSRGASGNDGFERVAEKDGNIASARREEVERGGVDPSNWVPEFGDALYRYAYFRVNNRAQAEDLVQETFLAGIKALDRFSGRASVKTWLTGILKNKIVDYYRKSSRMQSYGNIADFYGDEAAAAFKENGHWHADAPDNPSAWEPEQRRHVDRQDFWAAFYTCADRIPPKNRQVFIMREIDDVSSREICERLDITPQNLWTILHRARMALRKCLDPTWFNRP